MPANIKITPELARLLRDQIKNKAPNFRDMVDEFLVKSADRLRDQVFDGSNMWPNLRGWDVGQESHTVFVRMTPDGVFTAMEDSVPLPASEQIIEGEIVGRR